MTYNFDPDNWYENELAFLQAQHQAGTLSAAELEAAIRALDQRYEEMVERLDGTYTLPKS